MRQTAVEWLAKELYEKFEMKGDGILFDEFLKQAQKMEKQQIMEAYDSGWERADETKHKAYTTLEDRGSNYYNETFKTNCKDKC